MGFLWLLEDSCRQGRFVSSCEAAAAECCLALLSTRPFARKVHMSGVGRPVAGQTCSIEVNKMDAELEVRGQPKAVLANDYSAMKRAFEKQYWTVCDEKTPAKSYLERKLESLEKRELRPEKLGDVINYREDDSMELKPVWDSSGSFKAMKTACSVPLPRDSEELRSRITLLGTAWLMAAMHQTSNPLLKDLRPYIFTECSDARQMAHPTWTLLLQYEHEIRAQAYTLMETRGVRLEDAFRQAWCDQTTGDRHFLTPLALEHRKRPEPTGSDDHNRPPQLSKKQRKAEEKKEHLSLAVRLTRLTARRCVSTSTRRIWYAAVVEVALFAHVCGRCFKVGTPMYSWDHKGA